MTVLTLRPATKADAKRLAVIGRQFWNRNFASQLSGTSRDKLKVEAFEDFASSHPEQIILAEDDEGILGFAATEQGTNHVSDLCVAPGTDGKGIGAMLMKRMENRARNRGYDSLEIEVLTSDTRALSLYKYLGYRLIGKGMKLDRILSMPMHKTVLRKKFVF